MDDAFNTTAESDALTLLPEVEVRRALAGRDLTFALLVPPFRALGVGTLRVLRIVERPGAADLVAGYDRYERLTEPEPLGAGTSTRPPGAATST